MVKQKKSYKEKLLKWCAKCDHYGHLCIAPLHTWAPWSQRTSRATLLRWMKVWLTWQMWNLHWKCLQVCWAPSTEASCPQCMSFVAIVRGESWLHFTNMCYAWRLQSPNIFQVPSKRPLCKPSKKYNLVPCSILMKQQHLWPEITTEIIMLFDEMPLVLHQKQLSCYSTMKIHQD